MPHSLPRDEDGWQVLIWMTLGGGPGKAMEIKRILTFCRRGAERIRPTRRSALAKIRRVAIVKNPFAGRYVEDLSPLSMASEADRTRDLRDRGRAARALQAGQLRQGGGSRVGRRAGTWQCDADDRLRRRDARSCGRWQSVDFFFHKTRGAGSRHRHPACAQRRIIRPIPLRRDQHYAARCSAGPDEIAVICAYATRGRLSHRVGGLAADEIKGIDGLT